MMAPLLLSLGVLAMGSPPELGRVAWRRDHPAAQAEAARTGKPLLILFDEVPGCATVLGFGQDVLSDPEVVAVIEAETVPVAIYNNTGGADRRVLLSYGEPAWNNPVVRILGADGRLLAPRFAGPYTRAAFATTLATALRAAGRPVPASLLGAAPDAPGSRARATFAMSCFWEGEARLGAIEGVRAAQVGFLEGREAVEVEFDPRVISRAQLIAAASKAGVASAVLARSADEAAAARAQGVVVVETRSALRPSPSDAKYYLKRSAYARESLGEEEALKVNAALRLGQDPEAARAACGGR